MTLSWFLANNRGGILPSWNADSVYGVRSLSLPFPSCLASAPSWVSTACHHQPLTDATGGMGQGTRIYMTIVFAHSGLLFSFTYTGLGIQDRIMRQQPMGNAPRASDVVRKYLPQAQPGQGWCHG